MSTTLRNRKLGDAVTIRRSTPNDSAALRRLAELEGQPAPGGVALVAEVDQRVLAALWSRADVTLADPFLPTAKWVSLLKMRARHLDARLRLHTHPLRRAVLALRRIPAVLR